MAGKKSSALKKAAKAGTLRTARSPILKAAKSAAPSGAFLDIPVELIAIEGQIRSRIDQEGEPFLALVESIRKEGVLEPIIVTPQEGKYRLISGERRLQACRKLGLTAIPARVVDEVTAKDEIIALQLTENLQRADLDPIDTAQAVVGFIQARHAGEDVEVDGIINTMVTLEREPDRVPKEVADTVSAIVNISGKSLRSVQRTCSLLKLPEEIQKALREERIGVSQGYIFAANTDLPCLLDIFRKALKREEGITNAELEKVIKKARKPVTPGKVNKRPFSQFIRSVQSVQSGIEEQADAFRKSDLETLLTDLQTLITLIKGRLPESIDDGGSTDRAPLVLKQAKTKKLPAHVVPGAGRRA
jgi:ParB family transcriptional regulator, chromosome partitioning protein